MKQSTALIVVFLLVCLFVLFIDNLLIRLALVRAQTKGLLAKDGKLIQEEVLLYDSNTELNRGNADRSLLRTEVANIIHHPNEAKIVVNFHNANKQQRKCRNPRIIGRLSGKYLTMMRWDHDTKVKDELSLSFLERFPGNTRIFGIKPSDVDKVERDHRDVEDNPPAVHLQLFDNRTITNAITGFYDLPEPGRYFVEIIGQICNDFSFETDFNSMCMEDPDHFRITGESSFINVVKFGVDVVDANIMAKIHASTMARAAKNGDDVEKNENRNEHDAVAKKNKNSFFLVTYWILEVDK